MNTNDKNLEEAKQLNQKSRQGGTSSIDTTSANSASAQEARQLNSQYSSSTSTSGSGSSSSSSSSDQNALEEAKKLNQQSRQSKGK